jgi:hypothetical protein
MECRIDRTKHVGLLVASLVMLGASGICVLSDRGPIAIAAGWLGLVFFGIGFCVCLRDLLRPTTRIIINDEGIEDRRSGIGVIRWDEIAAIELRRMGPAKFICIEARDSEKHVSRASALNRFFASANTLLGYPPITVSFTGLSPSADEAWEYIKTNHPPTDSTD